MGAKKITEAASANYVRAAAEVRAAVERAERVEGRADQEVDAAFQNAELKAEQSTRNWRRERERFYREQATKQAAKRVSQANLVATQVVAATAIARRATRTPATPRCTNCGPRC